MIGFAALLVGAEILWLWLAHVSSSSRMGREGMRILCMEEDRRQRAAPEQ